MGHRLRLLQGVLLTLICTALAGAATTLKGFDLSRAAVPADQIHRGGPRRDGIPSIDRPHFVVAGEADFLAGDERVLGVVRNGVVKAYPFSELARTTGVLGDRVAGRAVEIRFDAVHQTASAVDGQGRELPTLIAYWFAWYAFHPNTEVFRVGTSQP